MSRELTDAQKMWVLMRDAGPVGVHSHDLRANGVTGQPSQRSKDIASKGVPIFTARENRGKRPGSRWWLAVHAPDWAVPVRPNGADPAPEPEVRLVCDATDRTDIRWREERIAA